MCNSTKKQIIEYYLMPESGYVPKEDDVKEGHYIIKKGTIATMLHDSFILFGSEFNKMIPSMNQLNILLKEGCYGRSVEWTPLQINEEEYIEIINDLLSVDMPVKYTYEHN